MLEKQKRWLAFYLLCAGEFMIVIDTTIINVALPSIQTELAFSEAGLVWVVNAYMVTYGGFLLLGGRLGDLYGQRRLFLAGIALFTVASLVCGLSSTRELLVGARAVNTSFMMGGALGLAALASLSEAHGYHAAFAVGAIFALAAALFAWGLAPGQPAAAQVEAAHG